ncbi:MAG: hypothetical protein U0W40_08130 [Acidimicrobiia bacterium]
MGVGLTLNPPTPVETVLPYLAEVDLLLVMSVNPGGAVRPSSPRCSTRSGCCARRSTRGLACEIEIDGGINAATTAVDAAAAGCDVLVAGSAIFKADDLVATANSIRRAEAALPGAGA